MGVIKEYFVFDGKRSTEWGVWISGAGVFNAPARDIEAVSIPGANGDIHLDNGRYFNISVSYPAFISKEFSRVDDFRAWLVSHHGYYRLEDTYHPNEYRQAAFVSGFEATPTARNLSGSFEVSFDCKPQRFLKSGEQLESINSGKKLYNPTFFTAKPLIRAHGNGTIDIGGVSITVAGNTGFIHIDCETQEAFYEGENKNNLITLNDGEFPVLDPGETAITYSGFTGVAIAPNWWTL